MRAHLSHQEWLRGVTVAKEIELSDKFENVGAQMLKEVAVKTNDVAGDGTTTATVLAQAISNEGMKGSNPIDLKKGIDLAVEETIRILQLISRKISRSEEITQVVTISANGDCKIGLDITEATKSGEDGLISVELEVVEGLKFDRGYISSYFVISLWIEMPYILIYDKNI